MQSSLIVRTAALFLALAVCGAALGERRTPLRGAKPEKLLEELKKKESIHVIVTVALDPEWKLTTRGDRERNRRRREVIRETKEKVLRHHPHTKVVKERDYDNLPSFVAEVNEAALRALAADDAVTGIHEITLLQPFLAQSTATIDTATAHANGNGGAGQTIVVIDSGVQKSHPFIGSSRVVAEACFSGGYAPNPLTSLCAGGARSDTSAGSGEPCTTSASCWHGTHVAGIAVGRATGQPSGVAPYANLIAMTVASGCDTCSQNWQFSSEDLVAALDHVLTLADDYTIAAVNLSLGYDSYGSREACEIVTGNVYREAIDSLNAAGIAVVAATGNMGYTGGIAMPACLAGVIAVSATSGATTGDDSVPSYANVADFQDLFAPGGNGTSGGGIRSSIPGSTYDEHHGTSMATPHVAGAIALLRQPMPASTYSVANIRDLLVATGDPVQVTRPDDSFTSPRLDIGAAMLSAVNVLAAPPNLVATAASGTSVTVSWSSVNNPATIGYSVERKNTHTGAWSVVQEITSPSTLTWNDTSVTAAKTYAYRVRARYATSTSHYSNVDYAATVAFPADVHFQALIRGSHIGDLRKAVDAWRTFAGLATSFSSYAAETGVVRAQHVTAIVDALNPARTAIGLAAFNYSGGTSTPAPDGFIQAPQIQQIRDAVK